LDLQRPVAREVIERCLDVAVHAPNGSNTQPYKFLCVDDADRKLAIADLYRAAMQEFMDRPRTEAPEDNVDRTTERQQRIARGVACSTCATTCTRYRSSASRSWPGVPTDAARGPRPSALRCSGSRAAGGR